MSKKFRNDYEIDRREAIIAAIALNSIKCEYFQKSKSNFLGGWLKCDFFVPDQRHVGI